MPPPGFASTPPLLATTTSSPMTSSPPRLILYHQTLHRHGKPVSLLPLIQRRTGITHVIIAALHLNDRPGHITLNDDPPDAPKYDFLWQEVATLRAAGVPVLGMLGGAAQGTFARLNGSDEQVIAISLSA